MDFCVYRCRSHPGVTKPEPDVVSRGIAPRKPYHWVLDASIMMSVQDNGRYSVQFTALADRLDSFISARLGREEMLIKEEQLSGDLAHRSSAKYLSFSMQTWVSRSGSSSAETVAAYPLHS